jgi:hypothetical protein
MGAQPSKEHQACRKAVLDILRRDAAEIPSEEVLALVAFVIGEFIGLHDRDKLSSERAIEIVKANILAGNKSITDKMFNEAHE